MDATDVTDVTDVADWRQQQDELEAERWMLTVEALDRCYRAGAKLEDLYLLARECGIVNYKPHADRVTSVD